MDHKEQHHLHHEKEREREKKHRKAHEREQEKNAWPIHPTWFVLLGIILTTAAIVVWVFFLA
jgi:hypothetical protein